MGSFCLAKLIIAVRSESRPAEKRTEIYIWLCFAVILVLCYVIDAQIHYDDCGALGYWSYDYDLESSYDYGLESSYSSCSESDLEWQVPIASGTAISTLVPLAYLAGVYFGPTLWRKFKAKKNPQEPEIGKDSEEEIVKKILKGLRLRKKQSSDESRV